MNYSVIVFDTAPTGHTLRLLQFPGLLEKGLDKIVELKNKFGGMIGQVSSMLGVPAFDDAAITGVWVGGSVWVWILVWACGRPYVRALADMSPCAGVVMLMLAVYVSYLSDFFGFLIAYICRTFALVTKCTERLNQTKEIIDEVIRQFKDPVRAIRQKKERARLDDL